MDATTEPFEAKPLTHAQTRLIVFGVLLLAYSNGANDNFKGVATLFGSGVSNYRRALAWATITTLAGSLLALLLGGEHPLEGRAHR